MPRGSLPQPLSLEIRNKAQALFESGHSYREIADELNVGESTLKSWRKRDNWKRGEVSNELAIAPNPTGDDVPEDLDSQRFEYEQNMRRAAVVASREIAAMPADKIINRADRVRQLDGVARKALRCETEKPHQVLQIGVLMAPLPKPILQRVEFDGTEEPHVRVEKVIKALPESNEA